MVFCGFQRSVFFFVCFFYCLLFCFFQRHLVPPPHLYICKQVLTPPPTNPMFVLPFSLTGKKTSRLLAAEHFGLWLSAVVALLWKQRSRDKIERLKSDWADEGKYSVVLSTDGKVYRSQDVSPCQPSPRWFPWRC